MKRKVFVFTIVVALLICGSAWPQNKPALIRLDYASYNPVSLLIKSKGMAESEFGKDGINVEWKLSEGSNRALEFLNSNTLDFGSTAGAAALMSKSNGNPIYGVYLYSKPEWAALVTMPGSGITKIVDLKGKRVAATLGTDPYIFLLRALNTAGLKESDIQLVPLQHEAGAAALLNKQVDAWSGLDPHIERLQVENKAQLFYRNVDFNTYGVLNVRKDFADKYPSYVERVISLYEKAKKHAKANMAELTDILAKEEAVKVEVAKMQLERTDMSVSVPGEELKKSLAAAGPILIDHGHMKAGTNIDAMISDYIKPEFAQKVVATKP